MVTKEEFGEQPCIARSDRRGRRAPSEAMLSVDPAPPHSAMPTHPTAAAIRNTAALVWYVRLAKQRRTLSSGGTGPADGTSRCVEVLVEVNIL